MVSYSIWAPSPSATAKQLQPEQYLFGGTNPPKLIDRLRQWRVLTKKALMRAATADHAQIDQSG
jgi:hypothetical protein